MSKKALRIIGGCFLSSALWMGWVWHNSARKVASIEQNFTLEKGRTVALAFTPALDTTYIINLEFDKAQKVFLDCQVVESSNIEWAIASNGKIVQVGNLINHNVTCNDTGSTVTVSFDAPDLILNRQYSLNLSVGNKNQQEIKLKSLVSVSPFGISVHYAFMDLAVQELALYALLIVGFGCLFPDMYKFVFCKNYLKSNG